MKILASAVHAAAGNEAGVRSVQRINFLPPDAPELPNVSDVKRMFGGGGQLVPAETLRKAYGHG